MFCTYACNGPHCFGFLQRYFVGTDLKESKALCGGFSVHGFVKIVVRASLDRGVKSLGRVGFESVESLGTVGARLITGVRSLGRVGFESVERLGRVGVESVVEPCKVVVACKVQVEKDDVC